MSDKKFVFSSEFEKRIDLLCKSYDKLYSVVNGLKNERFANYGLCCTDYAFRIIRPTDVATYVDYLMKMMVGGRMIDFGSPSDINVFNVSFVKKVLKENGSDSLEKAREDACGLSWINPKRTTLDDIRVMLENECFGSMIYSNWEMSKRVRTDQFESDLNLITDMKFSGTMRNVVRGIPGILESSDWFKGIGNVNLIDLIRTTIESFIIFTFILNIRTLISMKKYGCPSSSYDVPNSSHEISNFNESVDVTVANPVFIVLTEGKTPLISSGIKHVTHSDFTHVSIGFDPDLSMMYSFGGPYQGNEFSTDSYGCRVEAIGDNVLADKYVKVFVCWISSDNVRKMKEECQEFIQNQNNTVFDWRIFRNFVLGLDKLPSEKDKYHQVCSTFVNMLFKNAGIQLFDNINMPSPKDYHDMATADENKNKFVQIYYGKAGAYSDKYFKIANQFAMKKKAEQFDQVVTECCLLKTNRFTYSNKLPYNCNFRDIVCCDMHPHFKDTKSALIYIITNLDSPISMLVHEYASNEAIEALRCGNCPDDSFLKMIMRVCPPDFTFVDHHEFKKYTDTDMEDDYYKKHHNVGFHTDVNWLDKIAYGNNYLDGNYRKDAMGNNNTIAIANTLDMIWKMYYVDSCDNKTLADNICKVGALMLNIIKVYSQNRLPNWEFVRDVLAVLGEILTRSMLQLYANNTQLLTMSDTMEDTNDPGYMYSEAFYIEADENNQQNQNNSNNNNGKVQGASIQGDNGTKNTANTNLAKSKAYAEQFIKWVRKAFEKISEAFKNRHIAEINAVVNNKDLNNKISEAIKSGSYKPMINGVRNFDLKVETVSSVFSNIANKMNPQTENGEYSATEVLKSYNIRGMPEDAWTDDKKRTEALVNWALYGKCVIDNQTQNASKQLDPDMWNSVLTSLEKFVDAQKTIGDKFNTDLAAIGEKAKNNQQEKFASTNDDIMRKTAADSNAIQTALMNQFYKYNYETYQNIVNNFKSKGQQAQSETKTPEGQDNDSKDVVEPVDADQSSNG